jgi:hypothetical protein
VTTAILTIGVTVDASVLPVIKEAMVAARAASVAAAPCAHRMTLVIRERVDHQVVSREGQVCCLTSAATLHLSEWIGVMVVIRAKDPVILVARAIRVCGEVTRRHPAPQTMSRPRVRVITPTIDRTARLVDARMVMILRDAAAMDVVGWPIWLAVSRAS